MRHKLRICILSGTLLLCTNAIIAQNRISSSQNITSKSKTYYLSDTTRYSEATGYGYDFQPTPTKKSKAPFFFSVREPDGDYLVTVRLGSKEKAGCTTVRGESRRLFIMNLPTARKEIIDTSFVINVRSPKINDKESVHLKKRELKKLNWDKKLTLEFNGDAPVCQSITIRPANPSVINVFLCGNSTVVDQDNEPWASWGQMIPSFFDTAVCIANYAESGEAANTFHAAKRFEKALTQMKAGDYVFIQFGHNDQKQKGPGVGAYYSFMTSLKVLADEAKTKGAHVILVTPTQRRSFNTAGHIVDTHGEYPDAMRWMAAKEHLPLIDLNKVTRTLYETLGVEGSKHAFVQYPAGTYPRQNVELKDNTHFNPYGAYQIAKCVAEGIKKVVPELAKHLTLKASYNPAKPDDMKTFHWNNSPFTDMQKPDGN